jgi:hypothetical protein
VGTIAVGRAKGKPRELALPKIYLIPGGIVKISATIKELKGSGMVILVHPIQLSPICIVDCAEHREILAKEVAQVIISLTRW